MLLRTITVENGQREACNAAVLCSLAIPEIESNVLVYTLNEAAPRGTSWVYLAALAPLAEGGYQLGSLDSRACRIARQVLQQIVKDAPTMPGGAILPFHFIRIERLGQPLLPHPTCREQHHSLALGPRALQALLACHSSDNIGEPFYSAHPLPPQPYVPSEEDAPTATGTHAEMAIAAAQATTLPAPATPEPAASNRSEQMLREVQATLDTLVDMANAFSRGKPSRERVECEHRLQSREARLLAMEAQLQARQDEQDLRCARLGEQQAALDRRAAELDAQFKRLVVAKDRLRTLMHSVNGSPPATARAPALPDPSSQADPAPAPRGSIVCGVNHGTRS